LAYPIITNNPDFPIAGISANAGSAGIYVNENAAALVRRAKDALFLSIRGTNDVINFNIVLLPFEYQAGTASADEYDWKNMGTHYDKLKPLFAALFVGQESYIATNTDIKIIYVTGHSLGAAMVQKFMATHLDNNIQAVTFADPGFYQRGDELKVAADPRVTNILVLGDPALNTALTLGVIGVRHLGYDFILQPYIEVSGDKHLIDFYKAVATLLAGQPTFWMC
jgi:pimeloyl-ACP methyl ester carboxylesterase